MYFHFEIYWPLGIYQRYRQKHSHFLKKNLDWHPTRFSELPTFFKRTTTVRKKGWYKKTFFTEIAFRVHYSSKQPLCFQASLSSSPTGRVTCLVLSRIILLCSIFYFVTLGAVLDWAYFFLFFLNHFFNDYSWNDWFLQPRSNHELYSTLLQEIKLFWHSKSYTL